MSNSDQRMESAITTAAPESQLDYLRRQIQYRLQGRETSVKSYRRGFFRYQASAVLLNASITILAGLKVGDVSFLAAVPHSFPTNAVLVLGAVGTVVAAFGAFNSPEQSWYLNANTYAKLRALLSKLEFAERDPSFPEKQEHILASLFAEYQKINEEHGKGWQGLRHKQK